MKVSEDTNVRVVNMSPFFVNILVDIIVDKIRISFCKNIKNVDEIGHIDEVFPGVCFYEL